jgi:hypothetical protein
MQEPTTNLGLMKPEQSDYVDISVINGNMDIIDEGTVLKNQGVANAGKFMRVNSSGIVVAEAIANANGVNF